MRKICCSSKTAPIWSFSARAVLSAHRPLGRLLAVDALQRTQHLQLLVAHRIGLHRARRFHRHEAQKLQHVVLHHVAQRAGLVVIGDAVFQPDGFGHGDLHVVDMGGIPQRFVERIGEAQRHQILHRLLAEIMVDAEDLLLVEDRADLVVQRARRRQVPSDRLLHHDAGIGRNQAVFLQIAGDIAEQSWRDGEIEHADCFVAADRLFQLRKTVAVLGIHRNIRQPGEEPLDLIADRVFGLYVLGDRLAGEGAKLVVAHLGARCADDSGRFGKLAGALAVVERRQELALGEVAGAAKNDEIERFDGDDLAGHGGSVYLTVAAII